MKKNKIKNNKNSELLKVGIVGCGRIADHHLKFLVRRDDVDIVALIDWNIKEAEKLGKKYAVDKLYSSLDELLKNESVDVLHILTPPQYHYEQACRGIEKGIHLLIEKPITLSTEHAMKLYSLAAERNVKVCTNLIHLFNPLVFEAKTSIYEANLGDLLHAECFWSINYQGNKEVRETAGLHWSYELPGGIMQNNITHPIYLILDWIGKLKKLDVYPKQFGSLPQDITDHLDIIIEGKNANGKMTISTRPIHETNYLKLFFNKGNVTINFVTQSIIIEKVNMLPRSVNRILSNVIQARQLISQSTRNIYRYLTKKLVSNQGLQYLIDAFYEWIKSGGNPPISSELSIDVCEMEEKIFQKSGEMHFDNNPKPSEQKEITKKEKILVTGATGYIGGEIVAELVDSGYYVRTYVRRTSHTKRLEDAGVEIYYGDIRELEPLYEAANGMDVIVHAATAMRGSTSYMYESAVTGTKNIAEVAKRSNIKKVIYTSSFSIYDYLQLKNGSIINEESPLESEADKRGFYSLVKRKAEDIAISNTSASGPAWTILRLSLVFGLNNKEIPSLIGPRIGKMLISFGDKRKHLKLVHVKDVARAVLYSIQNESTGNRIFNISHEDQITVSELINFYHDSNGNTKYQPIYISYKVGLLGAGMLHGLRMIIGNRVPELNRSRLSYLCKDVLADSYAFRNATGWKNEFALADQLKREAQ